MTSYQDHDVKGNVSALVIITQVGTVHAQTRKNKCVNRKNITAFYSIYHGDVAFFRVIRNFILRCCTVCFPLLNALPTAL